MNSKTSVTDDFGVERQRFWSRGFVCQIEKVNARGHIPFSTTLKQTDLKLESDLQHRNIFLGRIYPDAGSPPSAMMESKILPLKLSSMDFLRIRVRPLLFTENAIVQSRTGM